MQSPQSLPEANQLIDRLAQYLAERETASRVSPGQYVDAYCRAMLEGDRARFDSLLRTVQVSATSDTPGIIPEPIMGDVTAFVDNSRPIRLSSRQLPLPPAGSQFERPLITQPTSVAVQSAQGDQLSSQKLTTTGTTVTKATYGGVLAVTMQDLDWTTPELMGVVVDDLAARYAIATEADIAAKIAAKITTNKVDFDISTADAPALTEALAGGAAAVYATAKTLPDTIYCAVNVWSFLAGICDGNDRPLFPSLSPINAPGTLGLGSFASNPMGLRLVVSPAFADDFFAVAASHYVETYETIKGLIMANQPSNLEVTMAYRGYFAGLVRAEGLCGLVAP